MTRQRAGFCRRPNWASQDSQFNLGILAAKGVGMPQNLEESYKWFALAAKAGDRDAAAKRDEIAKALGREQLERARASGGSLEAEDRRTPRRTRSRFPEAWQESDATTASIDMKKVVENIQRILNRKGYDAGGADGVMGAKTKAAIAAFQGETAWTRQAKWTRSWSASLFEKK